MAQTAYCDHCSGYHPIEQMRQILTKGSKRWCGKESIEAAKQGQEAREAFGRQVSAINQADTQTQKRGSADPE